MKLTPENIAKIEALLTDRENGLGQRGIVIKYNLTEIAQYAAFLSILRQLGIDLPKSTMRGMSKEDRAAFIEWLREKRKKKFEEAGLAS